ncbi:ParM/StbA family protein [Thermosulfurimonas sp. F29]|uniref:ParM/StbA family protein n=1 Tax=Thermosulfurimonas sp. F29 TaxID=2867247 RepID=UPI001C83E156|nr:hypothetical protein [Thermosulfurimonas sp. F29]MBX6423367.1 hypothetical protein [Thermosulfurimonas sp. F29]
MHTVRLTVGLDPGFGLTKAVFRFADRDEPRSLSFPSVLAIVSREDEFAEDGLFLPGELQFEAGETVPLDNGTLCVTGRTAAALPGARQPQDYASWFETAPLLAAAGISRILHGSHRDVALITVVSLPPAVWNNRSDFAAAATKTLKKIVRETRVFCVPQGLGILKTVYTENPDAFADVERLAVIDIGHNTTDVLCFLQPSPGQFRFLRGESLARSGVRAFVTELRSVLARMDARWAEIPFPELEYIAAFRRHRLPSDAIRAALDRYRPALESNLRRLLGEDLFAADAFVLGGGGAALLPADFFASVLGEKSCSTCTPRLIRPREVSPELANAFGQHLLAEELNRKIAQEVHHD